MEIIHIAFAKQGNATNFRYIQIERNVFKLECRTKLI